MSAPPVLWAVLHDLGRTGVPIALERLLRWQRTHRPDAVEVHVVSGRDGPLRPAFAAAASSVTALEPEAGRLPLTAAALAATQVLGRPIGARTRRRAVHHRLRGLPRPDVVLVQGAGAWSTYAAIEPAAVGARLVVHLHELDIALSRSGLDDQATAAMVQQPALVLGVCRSVLDLATDLGASPARQALVTGSADEPPGGWSRPLVPSRSDEVLSVGAAGWRKGTDRAVAAQHELARVRPGSRWHWVGEPEPSAWSFAVDAVDPLVRHPPTLDPWSAVADPAALVIPSREDPFPLVALEAGARGVPVVSARTGGLGELLADGRGLVVGQLRLGDLVGAVRACLDDPADATGRAEALRDHVRTSYATSTVAPRWLDTVLGVR